MEKPSLKRGKSSQMIDVQSRYDANMTTSILIVNYEGEVHNY